MICPTVTASTPGEYNKQIAINAKFAKRLHIDLMDGRFAPVKSVSVDEVWWPHSVGADLHVMYEKPMDILEKLILLQPEMVIIHAESDVHHMHFAAELHKEGVKAGLALLPETDVASVEPILHSFDHVLIFSGNLGHQGGSHANLELLEKAKQIRTHHKNVEIGWDGGVNEQNITTIHKEGVEIINVGGFIQNATNPGVAYVKLLALTETKHE